MGRKGKRKSQQQSIKGFRPGKEPPKLKKQRAKAQLGPDAGWAQKAMIDAVGDRSPREVQKMLTRWTTVLLIATVVLGGLGLLLYGWSVVAGVVVHLLAIAALLLLLRMRKQRANVIAMAESLGRGGRG